METMKVTRRFPIGAEIVPDGGGVHFRVWVPSKKKVEVALVDQNANDAKSQLFPLEAEEGGYFSGLVEQAREGDLYGFKLDEEGFFYPDPASRYQPDGPHGPSQVIDPRNYIWTDQAWKGPTLEGRVLYEMHVGTFTHEGTWSSAKRELLELADLGVTIIEVMPINEFPGQFGWGYDGVNLFAPAHVYGNPEALRDFINHAHALGLAVILDVVYNHFGPDGNYMRSFSEKYFTPRYTTEWGEAINFDGEGCEGVREFFITNARYWIEEFHFDGLRFDATQNIYDESPQYILAAISSQVRQAVPDRKLYLIAENERQNTKIVRPIEEGGYGLDALWNDDFHHTAMVCLTGRRESYYTDYLGTPQEFISAIKYGYLYQGQWYFWQRKYRGTSGFGLNPSTFVNFIQNHDQIANSAHGWRVHHLTDPGSYRAMTALFILAPGTPMLFQGQEFAASTPFYYFADHNEDLAKLIFKGRREFFKQFASIATPEIEACMPVPYEWETFSQCKLNYLDRHRHAFAYALHRDLLKLRRHDSVFNTPRFSGVDGAVIGPEAFIIRFFGDLLETRLLMVNFGTDFTLSPAPEPLLAPPEGMEWELMWSSENPRYGGGGTPPLSTDQNWLVLGHSAMVLIPKKRGAYENE